MKQTSHIAEKKPSVAERNPSDGRPLALIALGAVVALGWLVMSLAASSRMYFLTTYRVGKMVEPFWEPFAATNVVVLFCFGLVSCWLFCLWMKLKRENSTEFRTIFYMALSILPLGLWLLRVGGSEQESTQFCEAIWIAAWTGMSFGELMRARAVSTFDLLDPKTTEVKNEQPRWIALGAVAILSVAAGGWWYGQSLEYYQNFLLGYNDFGHFLQRVVNTVEGRGVLLESPVLPRFWDHFNPGLLLIVPLWKLFPTVKLVFVLQAFALSMSSLLIYLLSRRLGHSRMAAAVFGISWLAQPSVGQMNLAYTYGWHPITFAIPLLLGAIVCLLSGQRLAAVVCTVIALSMEESVFVMVALVATVCFLLPWVEHWFSKRNSDKGGSLDGIELATTLPRWVWLIVAILATLGFVAVYKYSGLAEFQTGRFVALGSSPLEILISPVARPTVFWGQVMKLENLLYVLLLWLPCGLPALFRGWRYLLPTILPLGVLIVWDHAPAHNLAFQYPSTLLPLFWLACLSGACGTFNGLSRNVDDSDRALPSAVASLATGLVLSLFFGQLPHSSLTLRDVEAMTYGVDAVNRRNSSAEDGKWLLEQVAKIRETKEECLATGRIAAHLVGNRDVETVGQYLERRELLSALPDRKGNPIKHYRWVLLDRQDLAKWADADIAQVEAEARANGFVAVEDRYGVVIFKRP